MIVLWLEGCPPIGTICDSPAVTQNSGRFSVDKRQNLRPWKKGQSGNPGGRPKRDLAAEIARAIFEKDPTALVEALFAGLKKGNSGMARAFQVLSDRGYGKLTEHLQMDAEVAKGVVERLQAARRRANQSGQ